MPSGVYTCKVCSPEEAFQVPPDEIGLALMESHFQDKHPDEYGRYLVSSRRRTFLEVVEDEDP